MTRIFAARAAGERRPHCRHGRVSDIRLDHRGVEAQRGIVLRRTRRAQQQKKSQGKNPLRHSRLKRILSRAPQPTNGIPGRRFGVAAGLPAGAELPEYFWLLANQQQAVMRF
jgi:hypothetical protein